MINIIQFVPGWICCKLFIEFIILLLKIALHFVPKANSTLRVTRSASVLSVKHTSMIPEDDITKWLSDFSGGKNVVIMTREKINESICEHLGQKLE